MQGPRCKPGNLLLRTFTERLPRHLGLPYTSATLKGLRLGDLPACDCDLCQVLSARPGALWPTYGSGRAQGTWHILVCAAPLGGQLDDLLLGETI